MRLDALRQELAREGLDALAITSPANIRYLCGASVGRAVLFVTPAEAYLLTHFVDLEDAQARARNVQVVEFEGMGGETGAQLKALPDPDRFHTIGFEADVLPVAQLDAFRAAMPHADFRTTSGLVARLAGVKDADEIASIRRMCGVADAATALAVDSLVDGMTERELGLVLDAFMRAQGASSIAFLLLQFGARSSLPHGEPLDTPLRRGDWVLIDIGPAVNGYNADLTRTLVFGKADDRQREVYETVLRAQLATLDAVRPGASGEEVDAVSRRVIGDAGYGQYYRHGVGHSIGPGPSLAPGHGERLEPGNVVTVEPGIYIPGWGGIRIEDTVLVTENGCERLTQFPKELQEISR